MENLQRSSSAARATFVIFGAWLLAELIRGGMPWTPAFWIAAAGIWALRSSRSGRSDGSWRYSPAAVFFICLAAYLSTFRWHGGDDIPTSLIPFSVLRYGTLALNPVLDPWLTGKAHDFTVVFGSNTLSVYAISGGVLALPLYLIPVIAGVVPGETFLHNLSKVSASLMVAASAAALYRAVSKRCSKEWAFCLSLLYGLGSWSMSVSSQALWQHAPAQLGVALGLMGLEEEGWRADALSGFGFALAAASRPDNIFFAAAAGLFVLFQRRSRLPGFVLGAAVPAALLASYWLHYTGRLRPPESAFQATIVTGFQPQALIGLMISPTRGLLFFFPAALFGFWGGFRRFRQGGAWFSAACAGTWVFMTFYRNWMGGQSFGPRYFASAAAVLAYLCAEVEGPVRKRPGLLWAWCAAVVVSVLIHASGGYLNWPGTYHETPDRMWRWDLHPLANLLTSAGGLGGLPAWLRAGIGFVLAGSAALAVLSLWVRLALYEE